MKSIKHTFVACLAAAAAAATTAATAAPAECQLPVLNKAQKDIVAKSEEGVEALQQHMWRTRIMQQYDIYQAADFAANRRAAERRCVDAMSEQGTPVAAVEAAH